MSDQETGHESVLLPGSHVTLFTNDGATKDVFLSLANDWRFARVGLDVREGDAETAARLYESETSPDLVIVQTDTIDDEFTRKLEALGGACAEGTAAIVIGPVNDVNLYRRLVGMGVSDYLVKPVRNPEFGNDIAATLIAKVGSAGSRLIALMGAKGGIGVTALAEGLAWRIADAGHKTFLMDAAGGWSTLSVGMNFEPTTTLPEAARAATEQNEDSLTRMLFNASEKLTVLSSGGDVMLDDPAGAEGFEALLNMVMAVYPVVVVDLSASPAHLRRTVLMRAHKIMLATAPTLPSVRATRSLVQEIKELRGGSDDVVDIVVNMAGMAPKHEVSKSQIEDGLGRKPAATIGFLPEVFVSAESAAKKLSDDKDGEAAVAKLWPLVAKILGTAAEDAAAEKANDDKKGGIGGFLTKLKARS